MVQPAQFMQLFEVVLKQVIEIVKQAIYLQLRVIISIIIAKSISTKDHHLFQVELKPVFKQELKIIDLVNKVVKILSSKDKGLLGHSSYIS
jgi:hypothetical protein